MKPKKTKSERAKQKQKRFSLNFYFSDRDSAYYSLCPSEWNPLELYGGSEFDKNGFSTINLPEISSYKYISSVFQRGFKKSKQLNEDDQCKSLPTDRPCSPQKSCSSYQDSGVCTSFDPINDDIEVTSVSNTNLLSPSPPPNLKTQTYWNQVRLSDNAKPQKTAKLILPNRRNGAKTFGVHLQLETVSTFNIPGIHKGDISGQQRHLHNQARLEMEDVFPSLSYTIYILFSKNMKPLIQTINSTMIGDLIFQLRIILFSPLLFMIPSLNIVLHVIIRFLHQVSLISQTSENYQYFPNWLEELWGKWEDSFYQDSGKCVEEIRRVYVDMWCMLLQAA